MLLDTPGLRGVGLVDSDDALERTFPEIEALTEECRFSDCAHVTEPGCAVLAVRGGRLDPVGASSPGASSGESSRGWRAAPTPGWPPRSAPGGSRSMRRYVDRAAPVRDAS